MESRFELEETSGLSAPSLFAAVPEAVFAVRDGVVVLASDRATQMCGEDAPGTQIEALIPDWRSGPDRAVPFVATLLAAGGRELPVEVRVSADLDGGLTVVALRDARPLEAGREAQAALAEAEERFRSLVEQIPAVVYADDGEITTYVSPQIERILGVTPEAYREDPEMWLRMVHPEDRPTVEAQSKAFLSGQGGDLSDYRMIRPDGSVVWIRDRAFAHRDAEGHLVWEHGLLFDVTELKDAEARVAYMAYHDALTGLGNRALFTETLDLTIKRASRNDLAAAVLFLDLDNFKLVNDSLGHPAGDALLVELAERLHRCTRDSDLIVRQGGDEFLMLMGDLDPDQAVAAADHVAHRVHEALEEPFELHGTQFHARCSIGISIFPRDARDAESLMKNADAAMYRAKRVEPGGHSFFSGDAADAMARLSYATRLREAIESERWVLHYQPVVDLGDGSVVGAEALIRWQDASGGLVPPGEFIPVAEELGLIEAIGDWVIGEVARQHREWKDAGLNLRLSFNLSPRQLWSPHLAERIVGRLHEAGVEPSDITAEITESSAMADPDRTQKILTELRAWGVRLAIDDFGTGYSSLARLKHMPVDILKIDRAFIRDVDSDRRLAGMVRAMIQVAHSLDMLPLAEGIETKAEWEFLRSNGCRLAQGFLFARPVPPEALPDVISKPGGLLPA